MPDYPVYDFDNDTAQRPPRVVYSKKTDPRCCENCRHRIDRIAGREYSDGQCKHPEYSVYDFCDDWEKR